ncbi:MAG TPA: DUF29 domain-containing protein [Leptospiraceae bacterium]|nr:DUF29 domain-containing protein [Leptospiraceae bacterium]HNF14212.1 DUF29 domain-containing protein [Leptospiraceae bacterium]HNF23143.1 DUF29 domain-containing protein [Leptospiraceae bacterium]HNH08158.1 DUF29 domain-containing protein [Leptospiraceae bacterium]HNI98845.1 DUF29 domain-containing protein [Leptospiraceae bacterium]
MHPVIDLKKLYEEDEHLWLFENAKLLREGRFELADMEHIAETLEDMGKRDFREILSRMRVLMVHLLKWIFQPKARSSSWKGTIVEQRKELKKMFKDSTNLKKYAESNWLEEYSDARDIASAETGLSLSTFPEEPPFSFEEVTDEKYLP